MHTSIRFLTFFLTCTGSPSVLTCTVRRPSAAADRMQESLLDTRGEAFFFCNFPPALRSLFLAPEPPLHSLSFFLFRYCHLNGLVSRAPVTAGAEGARRGRLLHSDMTLPCPKLPFQWNAGGRAKKGMTAKDDVGQEWE